jgi:4-hydroxybenzoate polyprenyltransferase
MMDWRAWAQLVRIPNTLTSCADVLAGMCIAGGVANHFGYHPVPAILMSVSSICFYWAGMVWNDIFDVDQDRQQGRAGPLVTGRISPASARNAGWALSWIGIALCFGTPMIYASAMKTDVSWRIAVPGVVGLCLAVAIYGYDGPCKKSPLAPWIMGLCRGLNMLLGVAMVVAIAPLTLGGAVGAVLTGHVLYVTGLTIAARREADLTQSRGRLTVGWLLCACGASAIALSPRLEIDRWLRIEPNWGFPLVIAILLLPLTRRAIDSIQSLRPQSLGMAIRQAIFSILFLDAAVALQFAGDFPGILIALLAIPTLLLARWFRAT